MYKILLISLIIFSGCSTVTYNATICDEIASEPNVVLPQECRKYSELEATKAFNKTKHEKAVSDKEALEFNQKKKK